MEEPSLEPPVGLDAILDNARAAAADLRAQIDLQVKAAESIETRATAVLTVGAGAVALVASRLRVEEDNAAQAIAAVVFGVAAVVLIVSCLGVLASRAPFSYGVDGDALVARVGEPHTRAEIAVTIADALRRGRNVNEASIEHKFGRFVMASGSLVALAASGAALFALGAIE